MTWHDAKRACAAIEGGWRLPTIDELNILFKGKDKIGGFKNYDYWSSTESDLQGDLQSVWYRNFGNGYQYKHNFNKLMRLYVRAVRDF